MTELVKAEIIEAEETALAVSFEPPVIRFDVDGVRAKVNALIEPYDGVTPESLEGVSTKDCKAFRADMNHISKELNDGRKEVKKVCEAPIKAFEAKVKELDALIQEPLRVVADVIASREEAEKAEKRNAIEDAYIEFCEGCGFVELIQNADFGKILDPKWLNKSCNIKKAVSELEEKVSAIMRDYVTLQSMPLEYKDDATLRFFETFNLAAAVNYDTQRKADQERLDALKAEREQVQEFREAEPEEPEFEEVAAYMVCIEATASQKAKIVEYMRSNGIHGRVISTGCATANELAEAVKPYVR